MEIKRTGQYEISCILDKEFYERYGLNIEVFEKHLPFRDTILTDLLSMANELYDIDFPLDAAPKKIFTVFDWAIIVFVKPNIVSLKGEYFEELEILKGIRRLICEVPMEKINMGIIDLEEKQRIIEEIKSDDDFKYLREYLMKLDRM